jgi:branched-chain amino acid transport system permease protein
MRNIRTLGLLAVIALSIVFPIVVGDPTVTSIGVYTLLFAGAAAAWNIFSGYTGYISLGHAAFYGLGGYTLAIICQSWHIEGGYMPVLLLPLAGLVAGVFAIPLGWVALHTRRYTFMVITIAIFYIFYQLSYNLLGITGGSTGIDLPIPQWSAGLYDLPFYYVSLILLLLVTFASWWICHSKFGLGLLTIRDDEDRALGLGVKTGRYKLGAYVISAFFVGMMGAIGIYYAGFVNPASAFNTTFDINVVVIAFLGGAGTLSGPIVGSLLLQPLQTYLNIQYGSIATDLDLVLSGGILLVIILVLPEGIVPTLSRRWPAWIASRKKRKTLEVLSLVSNDVPIAVLSDANAPVSRNTTAERAVIVRQHHQLALSIPRRPTTTDLPTLRETTQKIKAQRLVPAAQNAPAPTPPEEVTAALSGWFCPRCTVPLWFKDDTHFCTQCGLTLSLPKRERR